MDFDQPPVIHVGVAAEHDLSPRQWPMTIPAVRNTTWEELELLQHWRRYLEAPQRYLRHVLDD